MGGRLKIIHAIPVYSKRNKSPSATSYPVIQWFRDIAMPLEVTFWTWDFLGDWSELEQMGAKLSMSPLLHTCEMSTTNLLCSPCPNVANLMERSFNSKTIKRNPFKNLKNVFKINGEGREFTGCLGANDRFILIHHFCHPEVELIPLNFSNSKSQILPWFAHKCYFSDLIKSWKSGQNFIWCGLLLNIPYSYVSCYQFFLINNTHTVIFVISF